MNEPSFEEIFELIKNRDRKKFLHTIEFFPEEGMYHFDGHRDCEVNFSPEETKKHQGICPKCKKSLTVGVLNRVDNLADRTQKDINSRQFIPYKSLVPLEEIIADCFDVGKNSKRVQTEYFNLCRVGKSEFNVLLNLNQDELLKLTTPQITEGILRVRRGQVKLTPGFDGRYGKVEIFSSEEKNKQAPLSLF